MFKFAGEEDLLNHLNNHILTQGLKPNPVALFNGDGNVTRFTCVDVSDRTRLARMRPADNDTALAVSQFAVRL